MKRFTLALILLLAVLLPAAPTPQARAAQPATSGPASLSAADWVAIRRQLPTNAGTSPLSAPPGPAAYLKASNTETNDQFGYRVAASGDTVVVGAWDEDSNATGVDGNQADNSTANAGAVYVFVRSG